MEASQNRYFALLKAHDAKLTEEVITAIKGLLETVEKDSTVTLGEGDDAVQIPEFEVPKENRAKILELLETAGCNEKTREAVLNIIGSDLPEDEIKDDWEASVIVLNLQLHGFDSRLMDAAMHVINLPIGDALPAQAAALPYLIEQEAAKKNPVMMAQARRLANFLGEAFAEESEPEVDEDTSELDRVLDAFGSNLRRENPFATNDNTSTRKDKTQEHAKQLERLWKRTLKELHEQADLEKEVFGRNLSGYVSEESEDEKEESDEDEEAIHEGSSGAAGGVTVAEVETA
jgi:hypothetical protein